MPVVHEALMRALKDVTDPRGWRDLALELQRQGQYVNALEAATQWTRLEPYNGAAWMVQGRLLGEMNQLHRATLAFGNATACAPDSADVWASAGLHYLRAADYPNALHALERAMELAPGRPVLIGSYAAALVRSGAQERAVGFVEEHWGKVHNPHFTRAAAQLWTKQGQPMRAAAALEQTLARPRLGPAERAALGHQLGVALERAKHYDRAFTAHQRANEAYPRTWNQARWVAFVDTVLPYFRSFEGAVSEAPGHNMVFIVGMPRSGSTLLETILTMLPGVETVGESPHLHDTLQQVAQEAGSRGLRPHSARMTASAWTERSLSTMAAYRRSQPDASRIVDKMLFNFDRLDQVARLFPGSKVLATVRHPYDCCLSSYFQNFDQRLAFTRDLGDLGHMYTQHLRFLEAARELPLDILEVPYEAMVTNLQQTAQTVTDFLGLPFDERCLAFHDNPRAAATASYDQVRQPLYRSSMGRWRHYKDHLEDLFAAYPLEPQRV